MKLSHLIVCGVAALIPAVAFAEGPAHSTLFPGNIDLPIAEGSSVPEDCQYPTALSGATGFELACVVAASGEEPNDVSMQYISWLGQNGWRHGDDIIGGFVAVRELDNGCEQALDIFPHGEDAETFGFWFALEREPRCATVSPTAQ